jgi:plasmid segregation protein ParM
MLLKEYLDGGNYGIGHAIEKALPDFRKECFLPSCNRHYFSQVLEDHTHKYHPAATKHLAIGLFNQAKLIQKKAQNQLSLLRNEVDVLFVYGGGSIPLRKHVEELLSETAKQAAVDVVYCPPEYAVELNVRGLYTFTQSPIFAELKKKARKEVEIHG